MPVFVAVLIFVVLLLLALPVAWMVLRPSARERQVARQLELIGGQASAAEASQPEGVTLADSAEAGWLGAGLGERLRRLIRQAGATVSAQRVVWQCGLWGGGGALVLVLLRAPWELTLVAAPSAGAVPVALLQLRRMQRFARLSAQLPDTIDLMSRALKAGHTVSSALRMVAEEMPEPVRGEFREVYEQQTLGLPAREAFLQLAQRVPLDDMRMLVTSVLVQRESGGNLSQILDKAVAVIRERMRLRGQIRIYTAQGRVTGWVLCLLPFVIFGVLMLINRGYEEQLFQDKLGRHVLEAGLVMMLLGVVAMRKIIQIKV